MILTCLWSGLSGSIYGHFDSLIISGNLGRRRRNSNRQSERFTCKTNEKKSNQTLKSETEPYSSEQKIEKC